jgi:hypothetical protein
MLNSKDDDFQKFKYQLYRQRQNEMNPYHFRKKERPKTSKPERPTSSKLAKNLKKYVHLDYKSKKQYKLNKYNNEKNSNSFNSY